MSDEAPVTFTAHDDVPLDVKTVNMALLSTELLWAR
jgi:hypothetical protein